MANSLRKSAWDTDTGEDRSESQPHNLRRGERLEIKKVMVMEGLVPKKNVGEILQK